MIHITPAELTAPARGILTGLALGCAFWLAVAALVVWLLK